MTTTSYKRTSIDSLPVVAEIFPAVIADKIQLMLNKTSPKHHRQNAWTSLSLIRDELSKVLDKASKELAAK
jgi:hypothetical protein